MEGYFLRVTAVWKIIVVVEGECGICGKTRNLEFTAVTNRDRMFSICRQCAENTINKGGVESMKDLIDPELL